MPNISCSIHGLETLIPADAKISECKTYESASQTYLRTRELLFEIFSNFNKFKCPLPCTHSSFDATLQYFNKNTYIDLENRCKKFSKLWKTIKLFCNSYRDTLNWECMTILWFINTLLISRKWRTCLNNK